MTPAALAALHARCFRSPPPWSVDSFVTLLDQPHVSLLDDHQGRGFALMRVVADEAELLTLAIDPTHRRGGLARGLMGWFDRLALAQGAQSAFLEVAEDNLPARALYAAAGWQPAGRRSGYYARDGQQPVAGLLLRKSLT